MRTYFFFSSRRRHTRWTGDWSSDVCSSDLPHTRQLLRHRDCYAVSCLRSCLDAPLSLCRRIIGERAPSALDQNGIEIDEMRDLLRNAVGRSGNWNTAEAMADKNDVRELFA